MLAAIEKAEVELLDYKLDKPVGGSGVSAVAVIACDLTDADGATGTGFSYCLKGGGPVVLAAARDLADTVVTKAPGLHPEALWRRMDASLNRLGRGAHYLAMAALDVAAWDLYAKKMGVPLGLAMGGDRRTLPVYGSGGYGPKMAPEEVRDVAQRHVAEGFSGIKPRLAGEPADAGRLEAARLAVGDEIDVMADANEKCDLARAQWLASVCADYDLLWLEEALPSWDLNAWRELAAGAAVPLSGGEHLQGVFECGAYLDDGCFQIVQPDLAAVGGLTPALHVARLAETRGAACSPHFIPGLFIHLAAAAPNVTWLEDFPLLEPMFEIAAEMQDGTMTLPDVPGHGLVWAEGVREKFKVS